MAIQTDRKTRFFKINNRNTIIFRATDVGFSRHYLRRYYKKLTKFDSTKISDMSLAPQKTGFDFTTWKNKRDFQLLNLSKRIGWYGRNTSNPHMNEAYLLYRTLQYRKIRKSFLDYFLKQINVSIQTICRDLGINGAIVAKSTSFNYDDLLQKLVSGELKYSQLTDYAFPTRHE